MYGYIRIAAAIGVLGFSTPAFAQHLSATDLDRLSQERQEDIGTRNWGPPVNPPAQASTEKPLPMPATCMSPASETSPLYAAPNVHARKVGQAGFQLAVTDNEVKGWRQVLLNGIHTAWIPSSELGPYKPLNPEHPVGCVVTGERADGTVLFTHPDQ